MNSQELNKVGNKAKSEMEAFINRHLNDRAKGWPTASLHSSNYDLYDREEEVNERNKSGMLLTQ
jgi:hypothetical protein